MTSTTNPTEAHKDNLFGVCARLGEDFGFDPLWLRIAFGVGIILNMNVTVAIYFGLGLLVLTSRLVMPTRVAPTHTTTTPVMVANEDCPPLRQAA